MRIIKKIIRDIWGFSRSISEKHVPAYAAQAAYFIILSFIPFILLLMTSIRYTQLNREEVVGAIMQVIPDNLHEFIQGIVDEVYNKSVSIVPVSAVMAIWSSGKGVQALTNGFNCIYSVYETRNYILTRIRSAAYTLLFVIGIILTLTLQVFGNTLQRELRRHFPFLNKWVSMIISMRLVITLATLCGVFLILYKFVPNRKATFRSQFPGAVFSSVCWVAFSMGFSLYFEFFNKTSNMYGSMTTIILILLWMYICMNIVMIGASINHYFEERFRWMHQVATDTIKREYQQFVQHAEEFAGEKRQEWTGDEKKSKKEKK